MIHRRNDIPLIMKSTKSPLNIYDERPVACGATSFGKALTISMYCCFLPVKAKLINTNCKSHKDRVKISEEFLHVLYCWFGVFPLEVISPPNAWANEV